MELRHIRYFLAVAEEGSFTRAAERVGIGQPPLSLQIKDLEREVGTQLFHRVPHGAELTAAGKAFFDQVRNIPKYAENAKRAALRASRGELGAISIGFTASAAFNPVVANAIRRFRRAYPDVELSLEESNTTQLLRSMKEGGLDAVFIRRVISASDDYVQRLLSEEPLLAVLPTSHPHANDEELKLSDLSMSPFILYPREAGPMLFDSVVGACREAGFEPVLGQSAPQLASIVHLVAAELGISLVPASMRQVEAQGVVFRALYDVSPVAMLSLAWRRNDSSVFLSNFISCALA